MNCVRNQLLASAGFSLDENRGVSGRDSLDLLQHSFQGATVADDSLEPALSKIAVARFELLQCSHRNLLDTGARYLKRSTLHGCPNILEQDFIVEGFG